MAVLLVRPELSRALTKEFGVLVSPASALLTAACALSTVPEEENARSASSAGSSVPVALTLWVSVWLLIVTVRVVLPGGRFGLILDGSAMAELGRSCQKLWARSERLGSVSAQEHPFGGCSARFDVVGSTSAAL